MLLRIVLKKQIGPPGELIWAASRDWSDVHPVLCWGGNEELLECSDQCVVGCHMAEEGWLNVPTA